MSATGRGAQRREHDFYPTPAWPVERFLERVDLPTRRAGERARWLEPCVGDGAIVRACDALGVDVDWTTVDIRPECIHEVPTHVDHYVGDIRRLVRMCEAFAKRFDVVLTNPPFNLALAILRALRGCADVIVFLLRLNWLEGKRAPYLREEGNMPNVHVLPQRPQFMDFVVDQETGEKKRATGDATAYAWMVWDDRGHRPVITMSHDELVEEVVQLRQLATIHMLNDTPRGVRERTRVKASAVEAQMQRWLRAGAD